MPRPPQATPSDFYKRKLRYKKNLKRIIIYFLLIMLASLLQTCLFPLLDFLWTAPNLLLIITFSYGLSYGTSTGVICGMFAGLMMDLFYDQPFGLFILIYSYLGFFSGLFRENYRTDSLLLPLAICFVSDIFYNLAMLAYRVLTVGATDIRFIIVKLIFPEMFFTLLVTIIVYRILLSANRKLDRIDDLRGQNAA